MTKEPFHSKASLASSEEVTQRPEDPLDLERREKRNKVVLTWTTNFVSDEIAGTLIHAEDCKQAWNDF